MRAWLYLFLILGLSFAYTGISFAKSLPAIDRIVAIVDNDVITYSELEKHLHFIQHQYRGKELPAPSILKQQVLEMLIQQSMELQFAEKTGITIKPQEVEEEIKQIALQNQLDVPTFLHKVHEEGITETEFRQQVQQELMIRRVHQRDVYPSIQVTPKEVAHFMKQHAQSLLNTQEYRLGHILISIPSNPTSEQLAAATEKAERVFAQLKEGADFAKTAALYSNDSLALDGGDLGWRPLSEIPSLLNEFVKTMQVAELKGPLRSNSGFHIIKLLDIRSTPSQAGTSMPPLTEEKAAELLRIQKAQERVAHWRRDLRANTFVHISLEH